MTQWTAEQIGNSYGAYSGEEVSFEIRGVTIQGRLTRSDIPRGPITHLSINGRSYALANSTVITIL